MENQTKTKELHPRVSGPKLFLKLSEVCRQDNLSNEQLSNFSPLSI